MTPGTDQPPANKPAQKPGAETVVKKRFEMNSKNVRLLLVSGMALLVVLFFAIIFLGLSALSSKSSSLVDLKSKSQIADNELLNLEQSKKDVEKYAYFKTVAKTVIPSDKDQAEAVLQIFQFATNAGIKIQSITFPTSNLGLSTTSTSAAQDATSSSAASTALTQAKPVTGISGLYSLPLTITPDTSNTVPPQYQVTYPKMLAFLSSIEDNRRTAQITDVSIQPPTGTTTTLSFSLTINIFMKP